MTYRDDDTAAKSYSPCVAQSRLLAINVKKMEACLHHLMKHCSQALGSQSASPRLGYNAAQHTSTGVDFLASLDHYGSSLSRAALVRT